MSNLTEKEAQDIILGRIKTVSIEHLAKIVSSAPNCCAECVKQHVVDEIFKMKVYQV